MDFAGKTKDERDLDGLAIAYFVWAGVQLLILVSIALLPMILGLSESFGGMELSKRGVVVSVLILPWAALNAFSGYALRNRKYRTFSLVLAGLNCLSIPLGLALGIYTFSVLNRPGVLELYDGVYQA